MSDFLVVYIVGVVLLAVIGLLVFTFGDGEEDKRDGSISFFVSFVWPAALIYWIATTVVKMARTLQK